jgi:hypothetical protein
MILDDCQFEFDINGHIWVNDANGKCVFRIHLNKDLREFDPKIDMIDVTMGRAHITPSI